MDNPSYPLSIPIRRPYDVTIDLVYTAAPEKSRIWRPPMRGHARPDRCRLARATLASAFPSIQITLAFRRWRRVREGSGHHDGVYFGGESYRSPSDSYTTRVGALNYQVQYNALTPDGFSTPPAPTVSRQIATSARQQLPYIRASSINVKP